MCGNGTASKENLSKRRNEEKRKRTGGLYELGGIRGDVHKGKKPRIRKGKA